MKEKVRIVILRAYRPFLTSIALFERDNFRHHSDVLIRNIGRFIGICILFFLFVFVYLGGGLFDSYNRRHDLTATLLRVSYCILSLPTPFIYIYMIWKKQRIIETLEQLHGIVVESKYD